MNIRGLIAPFSGFKMIFTNKKVLFASIIPILVNVLLFILLALLVYSYYDDVLALVVKNPDTTLKKIFYWVTFSFFMLFSLAVFVFSFSIIGAILLSPFSGIIARNVYKTVAGDGKSTMGKRSFFKEASDSFKIELKKLFVVFIPIALLYVIGFFIPPLAVIAFILSCWAITFEYMDYIMEEKGLKTTERVRVLFTSPIQTLVFGFIASFMVSIPIIGLFCIPSSVAGATLLFTQIKRTN